MTRDHLNSAAEWLDKLSSSNNLIDREMLIIASMRSLLQHAWSQMEEPTRAERIIEAALGNEELMRQIRADMRNTHSVSAADVKRDLNLDFDAAREVTAKFIAENHAWLKEMAQISIGEQQENFVACEVQPNSRRWSLYAVDEWEKDGTPATFWLRCDICKRNRQWKRPTLNEQQECACIQVEKANGYIGERNQRACFACRLAGHHDENSCWCSHASTPVPPESAGCKHAEYSDIGGSFWCGECGAVALSYDDKGAPKEWRLPSRRSQGGNNG